MEAKTVEKTYRIGGMTCPGCERTVERIFKRLHGVIAAKASFSTNTATVRFDSTATGEKEFAAALAAEDYSLLGEATGRKAGSSASQAFTFRQFIGMAVIIAAVFIIVKNTVGFNFIPEITPAMGYGMLFVVGLLTSLHCVAMCGGLNISQCVSYRSDENGESGARSAREKLMPAALYNLGRVVSYTVIGGVVGALGQAVSLTGWARGLIAILSGVFMVIMGISMLGVFPWLNKIVPRMPRFLRSKADKARNAKGPFFVGLVNGFMPCGPLQAMQLYALGTGSFLAGGLSMLFFSLGTVPLMFGLGALSSVLSKKFTASMMKVGAVLVLVLGLLMASRGFALSGVSLLPPTASAAPVSAAPSPESQSVQTITSELTTNGYPEITVQKGIPVRWNIHATAKNINGCNNKIVIAKLGIEKELRPGDNIIEFTPTEEGTIPYSCWMGMITSRINVVDQNK